MEDPNSTTTTLLAALSTLPPPTLSALGAALSAASGHRRRRTSAILSSRPLFSVVLRNLYSLSLPQKSLLIAKYLLSTLQLITPFLAPIPPSATAKIRLRDLDSVLVLLLFCELRQHDPLALEATSPRDWHRALATYFRDNVLSLSSLEVSPNEVVRSLVDVVAKCGRFVGSATGCGLSHGREVAASVAAVVALPSVEVAAAECAICKEEMSRGRDVCELPCQHRFHWTCMLTWLTKRNTCPCCRHRLPTDDVYGEIERLWEVVVARAARPLDGCDCVAALAEADSA